MDIAGFLILLPFLILSLATSVMLIVNAIIDLMKKTPEGSKVSFHQIQSENARAFRLRRKKLLASR